MDDGSVGTADAMASSEMPALSGLCLSGGGFRAMVFHVGAIVRLNQLGLLQGLDRVSSVSGGSITSGLLGLRWSELTWMDGVATNLEELVVRPVFDFAGRKVDVRCIVLGLVTPGRSASQLVARAYDRALFHGATLQDLPSAPRFVIDATNVQTGHLFRFSKECLADWSLGQWVAPTTRLADAVAASSAAPPVVSPFRLQPSGDHSSAPPAEVNPYRATHPGFEPPRTVYGDEFLRSVVLTDGGVYDNLGLQVVLPEDGQVFVSDGGAAFKAVASQPRDWVRHFVRAADIIDSQVRALRKRELVGDFVGQRRHGTYWGINSHVEDYGLADALTFTPRSSTLPWHIHTRLTEIPLDVRQDLLTWGYIVADTALRRWVRPDAARPSASELPA